MSRAELSGQLEIVPLSQYLQWIQEKKLTGTLTLSDRNATHKKLYFQDGILIFFSSSKPEERPGQFLVRQGYLSEAWVDFLLADSRRQGHSFTGTLLRQEVLERQDLQNILSELAQSALNEVCHWRTGHFEFSNELPEETRQGPIKLPADLTWLDEPPQTPDQRQLLIKITQDLNAGQVNMAPNSRILGRLQQLLQQRSKLEECLNLMAHDPILTAMLLRIKQYHPPNLEEITHPKKLFYALQPTFTQGLVEGLCGCLWQQPADNRLQAAYLRSLRLAFCCQLLAKRSHKDMAKAFTAGLLADLGQMLLLERLQSYGCHSDDYQNFICQHHHNAAALLGRLWQLPTPVQELLKHQYAPDRIQRHSTQELARIVLLARHYCDNCPGPLPTSMTTDLLHDEDATQLQKEVQLADKILEELL